MLIEHLFRLNEHMDVRDALARYRNDPAVFISFTDEPKIGIRPTSIYNTPIGVYAYPLSEMWIDLVDNRIPFASDRPYVNVIRSSGRLLELETYSVSDLKRDTEALKAKYLSVVESHMHTLMQNNTIRPNDWDNFLSIAQQTTMRGGAAGQIWNITRLLAKIVNSAMGKPLRRQDHRGGFLPNEPVLWNTIFRSIGYDGVVDRSGIGVIHRGEPTQAVFFSSSAFRLLERVTNVRKAFRQNEVGKKDFQWPNEIEDWVNDLRSTNALQRKRFMAALGVEWSELLRNGTSDHFELNNADAFRASLTGREGGRLARVFAEQEEFPDLIDVAIRFVLTNPYARDGATINHILSNLPVRPTTLRMVTSPEFIKAVGEAASGIDRKTPMKTVALAVAERALTAAMNYETGEADRALIRRLLGPVWSRIGPHLHGLDDQIEQAETKVR